MLITAVSCKPEQQKTAGKEEQQVVTKQPGGEAAPVSQVNIQVDGTELRNEDLQATLMPYKQLRDALTKGNTLQAKRAALALQEGIKGVSLSQQIQPALLNILQTGDIEQQRSQFALLNNVFIHTIRQQGVKKGKLYVVHCPMALNDKGAYWLTETKEVINPYFGSAMLNCGSIDKTIE